MRAALLFALLVSTPAFAAQEKTPSAVEGLAANPTSSEAKEEKICKRIPATESRLGAKRVCKTATEWRREQDRFQRVRPD